VPRAGVAGCRRGFVKAADFGADALQRSAGGSEMVEHKNANTTTKYDVLGCDPELDKSGGSWLLTGWLDVKPVVVLRLKITKEGGAGDPFDVQCEVRRPGQTEFEVVASFAELDEFALLNRCMCAIPEAWRHPFFAMFRKLSSVLSGVDLSGNQGNRYAAEPLSSRDYLMFGAADDLPRGDREA